MCGTEVTKKDLLPWRGNCHIYDAKVPMQAIDEDYCGTNLPASYLTEYKDVFDPDGRTCLYKKTSPPRIRVSFCFSQKRYVFPAQKSMLTAKKNEKNTFIA